MFKRPKLHNTSHESRFAALITPLIAMSMFVQPASAQIDVLIQEDIQQSVRQLSKEEVRDTVEDDTRDTVENEL